MAPLMGTLWGQRKTRRNGKGSLSAQQVAEENRRDLAPLPASPRLTNLLRGHEAHAPIMPMGRLRPGGAESPGRGTRPRQPWGLAGVWAPVDEEEAALEGVQGKRGGWRRAAEPPRTERVHLSQNMASSQTGLRLSVFVV